MKGFKEFLARLFVGTVKHRSGDLEIDGARTATPQKGFGGGHVSGFLHKIGDVIGQKYEVYDVLGVGGFGIVYLAYDFADTKCVFALKTLRDEYLKDPATREQFRKEAGVWVGLGCHPYLVSAFYVDKVSWRLYIVMDYIPPNEHGLNSLEGYLNRRPPDFTQSLRWAIQFCHGMEYAYLKGVRCHRDIKPQNILIDLDGSVKISDFGLAGVIGTSSVTAGIKLGIQQGRIGFSVQTAEGRGFGTPTHMPPEQFNNAAACDERSDIYSFGITLFQMRSGGRLPFLASLPRDNSGNEQMHFFRAMHDLHRQHEVPRLQSRLFPIIQTCLEKEPENRYQTFEELRSDLENLLRRATGEVITPPSAEKDERWERTREAVSLFNLGRYYEAIQCIDKALDIEPENTKQIANLWNIKGRILSELGPLEGELACLEEALRLDPYEPGFWVNKGNCLYNLNRNVDPKGVDEAFCCYERALELDPSNQVAWYMKGYNLADLDRYDEAVRCFKMALMLDPLDPIAWSEKGKSLESLNRIDEAIRCYARSLEINPGDAECWEWKGDAELRIGKKRDAAHSYQQAAKVGSPGDVSAKSARKKLQELV